MDETILFPSPNWFQVSGMAVSTDGWLFYGGPSKNLCVLEPLPSEYDGVIGEHNGYRAHIFAKAHGDKITSIDACPAWPVNKSIITGAADGSVKEWTLEKVNRALHIKSGHNHSMHLNDQEEVAGLGYSTKNFVITVGGFGRIVKWDLKSNVVKTYNLILSKFKPTCIACSPHISLQVAVGTKQGVVLVIDLNDTGKTIYKMRCHDDEILSLSWCPQYEVTMKKFLKESEKRKSANARMEKIRQDAEKEERDQLDESALVKTLPEDSFDDTVVEEDDTFDIYKDHEEDEFGHKKYKPVDILVKVKDEKEKDFDYLAECQRLRDEILKKKDEPEPSISSLVDALDKTHVDDDSTSHVDKSKPKNEEREDEHSKHPQRHLLATIGKYGNLRVWSKSGKLVGSGAIQSFNKNQHQKVRQPAWATVLWYKPNILLITDSKGQLLECNPLNTDCKNKLDWRLVDTLHKRGLFCIVSNAPRVQNDSDKINVNEAQNKVQSPEGSGQATSSRNGKVDVPEDQWFVWTAAQDRTLACYSVTQRRKINTYNTCGGFIYTIQCCPYDARKIAFSVGDGAVRIWEGDTSDDDSKLEFGHVTSYWQNVQGKVLTVAWHPTKENILAFGTAESRVGILDIGGKSEKPARVLHLGVTGGVYALSWGARGQLYACGGGGLAVHRPDDKDEESKTVPVTLEGQAWQLTSVQWFPAGLMVGSFSGSVALLSDTTYEILAVNFIFKKMIHSIEWHPQFTSNSSEESPYKDLIAVSAMDKCSNIAILKYSQKDDGTRQLETFKWLEGHKLSVLQLAWNPHIEGQLLSSSQDYTARVWDVAAGACTAVFPARGGAALGVAWSAFPRLRAALSGGADCCVRLWRPEDHPPELYEECKLDMLTTKKEKKRRAVGDKCELRRDDEKSPEGSRDSDTALYGDGREAQRMDVSAKAYKRFLLPVCSKEMNKCHPHVVRKLAQKCGKDVDPKGTDGEDDPTKNYDTTFLKMFGTTNEFNELLDIEMQHHLHTKEYEAWIMLSIFRGQIDPMIKFASQKDLLCPFLVSISPCVSFKYWKDVIQLYVAQIDRCVAQRKENKLDETRRFGGATFRKAALLLSAHDVLGAARCLSDARLYREAYVLCRARHMDSIAEETLRNWVQDSHYNGCLKMAVLCYVALGELSKATTVIAGMNKDEEEWLSLAVDLAKISGQHTFAGHLEDKKEQIKQNEPKNEDIEDTLEQLPTKLELLMKNNIDNRSEDCETKE